MIENTLLAISGLVLLVLSAGVYVSNPKKPVNRALSFFLVSGFIWLLANFLTNISDDPQASLFFARTTLVGATLIPLSFLFFVITYTNYRGLRSIHKFSLLIYPAVLLLLAPTSLNIERIGPNGLNAVIGPVYYLLLFYLFLYFAAGITILIRYYRRAPNLQKSQLNYIFTGLFLTLVPAVITNGILPTLGYTRPSAYGPIAVVIMSAFTTIAIVKHSLLDIRLVVARTLGYLLVIGALAASFALVSVTLTSLFLGNDQTSWATRAIYVFLALLLALAFQPLKRVFDRITNNLFYRDAYDSSELLNTLNRSLVTTIDLEDILNKSASIITEALKVDYCAFAIRESHEKALRVVRDSQSHLDPELIQQIASLAAQHKNKAIVLDELGSEKQRLKEAMQAANLAALVKLQGIVRGHVQHPGYILLGQKRSGGLYSTQDVQILEIIADELVIAIQNALRFEEIQQFNITLRKKIDEATHELRRVNARLRELDKTKDEFISMASHQLRTPLTAVKGYLSMVLEGDAGPVKKEQKELINRSFAGAQKMVYLIADMLNVSRLQTGKFVIDNHPTDLAEVVQGEVDQLLEEAAAKQIKLTYQKPAGFPVLNLDETKIRQVIMNFLDNALYYTPNGGGITVKLESTSDSVTYTVTDTGVGVPKSVQHHLFSKFYRADNAKKMRPDGTGLGLFMAKKVVVAQGGAIIFKSTEGKGSTFGFSFPRKGMEVTEKAKTAAKK